IQTELNALVVGAGTILKNLGDPDGADAIARGLESEVKALRDAFKGLTENPDTNGLTKEIVDNALAFRRLLAAQSPATHPATLPPVPPPLPTPGAAGITLTWQLQGVSFDDGGTVTGTFNFDTTRWVSTDWNIT